MSQSEMSRFIAAVSADAGLRTLAREKGTDASAVIALAQSKGYDIGPEDIEEHVKARSAELTEEQLGGIAGGAADTGTGKGIPSLKVIVY